MCFPSAAACMVQAVVNKPALEMSESFVEWRYRDKEAKDMLFGLGDALTPCYCINSRAYLIASETYLYHW